MENINGSEMSPMVLRNTLCRSCTTAIGMLHSPCGRYFTLARPSYFQFAEREDTWTGCHHSEDRSFQEAVAAGCHICHSVSRECPQRYWPYASSFRSFYGIQQQKPGRFSLQIVIEVCCRDEQGRPNTELIEHRGSFLLISALEHPTLALSLLPSHVDGWAHRQDLCRRWLKQCTSQHESCKQRDDTSFDFNIRLLALSGRGNLVRLANFESGAALPKYTTLSHRWKDASEEELRLTKDTRGVLTTGVAIGTLPDRFQKAVQATHTLNVGYLWIDALCIEQDSELDWQRRAGDVGDIYAESLCHIMVAEADLPTATDCGQNSGQPRSADVVPPVIVDNLSAPYVVAYDDAWVNNVHRSSLLNRAWVMQEYLASRRTLIMLGEQCLWECHTVRACEWYPRIYPDELLQNASAVTKHEMQAILSSQPHIAHLSTRSFVSRWCKIVERYARCTLTSVADKLGALEDLAARGRARTRIKYVQRLWMTAHLARALLWRIVAQRQADGRPSAKHPGLPSHAPRAAS